MALFLDTKRKKQQQQKNKSKAAAIGFVIVQIHICTEGESEDLSSIFFYISGHQKTSYNTHD